MYDYIREDSFLSFASLNPLNKKHLSKEKCFRGFSNGAQERTRTSTPCGTATSRLRVYQFHHLGMWCTIRTFLLFQVFINFIFILNILFDEF